MFKPKRLRFSSDDDLALLREVVANNPLQEVDKWKNVQDNIENTCGKLFTIRALKEHLQLLLTVWLKKNKDDQIRSGVEEIYSERDHLRQEISDLSKEFNLNLTKKKNNNKPATKVSRDKQLGRDARENIALNFHNEEHVEANAIIVGVDHSYASDVEYNNQYDNDLSSFVVEDFPDPDQSVTQTQVVETPVTPASRPTVVLADRNKKVLGPTRKRQNKTVAMKRNAFEYLNSRGEKEYEIKNKELELEEKKIKLEERRLKIQEEKLQMDLDEQKERSFLLKERMTMEFTERQQLNQLIESQQKIIDSLLKKLDKYPN